MVVQQSRREHGYELAAVRGESPDARRHRALTKALLSHVTALLVVEDLLLDDK